MSDNDIKVGEYVRTKTGSIGKLHKISTYKINNKDKKMYLGDFGFGVYGISYKDVAKHSFNIIDIIEVGDYVNGYKVLNLDVGYVYVDCTKLGTNLLKTFTDYQIKTIRCWILLWAVEPQVLCQKDSIEIL